MDATPAISVHDDKRDGVRFRPGQASSRWPGWQPAPPGSPTAGDARGRQALRLSAMTRLPGPRAPPVHSLPDNLGRQPRPTGGSCEPRGHGRSAPRPWMTSQAPGRVIEPACRSGRRQEPSPIVTALTSINPDACPSDAARASFQCPNGCTPATGSSKRRRRRSRATCLSGSGPIDPPPRPQGPQLEPMLPSERRNRQARRRMFRRAVRGPSGRPPATFLGRGRRGSGTTGRMAGCPTCRSLGASPSACSPRSSPPTPPGSPSWRTS